MKRRQMFRWASVSASPKAQQFLNGEAVMYDSMYFHLTRRMN